jgi:chromosome segregation ATPase
MFRKTTFVVLGLLLIAALLFGGRLIPYAKTAYNKARDAANDHVPISFQIDAAKEQLKKIEPEIKDMVWQIAKEKAQIKRLESDLAVNQENLKTSQDEMMTLRRHLDSGEEYYVATTGKAYTNTRVKEDLAHRFSLYKTAKQTVETRQRVLESRQTSLAAALEKLDEAQALQRELQVKIENLTARNRMNEVAKTATTSIDLNDSQLARTAKMIDEISARIDAEEEMLNLAPRYFGQIPVGEDSITSDTDVVQEMDAYFAKEVENEDVAASK